MLVLLQAGADLVVGPLQKAAADVIANHSSLPVTTLLLNQISARANSVSNTQDDTQGDAVTGKQSTRLYQFGLPLEEEARQVAERAWLHGYKRALSITPEGHWGERLFNAFADHWRALGGQLLESQDYPRPNQDFAGPVKRILNVDASELRAKRLGQTLGRAIESQSRRRGDADFVFLAGLPDEARQLRPQLDFYNAVNLPVLATSHVFRGTPNRVADQDLNGITFADMPWIIRPEHPSFSPLRAVTDQWPMQAARHSRLHALGIDAYQLVPALVKLRVQSFARLPGATGELRITRDGRVQRQLSWAKFVDGQPRPLGNSGINPSLN